MRITVLCAAHSLGDERVVCRQAFSLAKLGHKVLVLGRGDPDKTPPKHSNLELRSVEPLIRGGTFKSRIARLKTLFKMYSQVIKSSPDIIAAHEPDSAFLAIIIKAFHRIPVHFDIHECFEEMAASRMKWPFKVFVRSVLLMLLKFISRRCDWITVVSPVTESQYKKIREDDKVTVIHNSPPIDLFPCCNHKVKTVTICHEGWLDESRGMEQLLKAVKIAAKKVDLRLDIVGAIRLSSQPKFDKLLDDLEIKNIVNLTGWVPYNEVGSLDSQSQIGIVCLQPSGNNYGSLSNKVYSYMACSQAVIVPKLSATSELVKKYNCGFVVDTTNVQEIAFAIIKLITEDKERMLMGKNGRLAIKNELGWDIMLQSLNNIYQGIKK